MKTGTCEHCGKERPLKARGLCSTCYKKDLKATRKARQTPTIILSFEGNEGLFEELKELAHREYRPLDWQIMKILRSHVQGPDDMAVNSRI